MNAEVAMSEIGKLITAYTDDDAGEVRTLFRIARVLGEYEAATS